MADLCRLCAAVRIKAMLNSITYEMCQKLKECFAIEICQPGDELPKCACVTCLATLQDTFAFFKKIKESQESLSLLFDESSKTLNDNSRETCKRLSEINMEKNQTICEVASVTSSEEVLDDFQKNTNVISNKVAVGIIDEDEDEDGDDYELYEVMVSDSDMLLDSTTVEDNSKEAAEISSELCDNSTEVTLETYTFQDEANESPQEEEQNIEDYEESTLVITDNEIVSKLKATTIEVLPATNDFTVLPKDIQTTNDKIQISEWKNYTWICRSCSDTCVSFVALVQHAQEKHDAIDHNNLQYECADCHKMCVNYNKFLNHVRFRHHSKLKLRCDVCDGQQENYTQLAIHRESVCEVTELYPLVDLCKICGKSFHNYNATLLHARSQHGQKDEMEWHQCSECEKRFKRITNLRAHEKIHSGCKEFTCEICDRKFRLKNNLDVHLYAHINEKAFECKICKKSFKTPASLEKHHLIHKNIRKFACDYCEKDFRTKDQKLSHERIHTGEKPFKCTFCDRSFRFRSGLMGHINTHTGERPYSCEDCGRRFTIWGNMNKHVKRCSKRNNGGEGIHI